MPLVASATVAVIVFCSGPSIDAALNLRITEGKEAVAETSDEARELPVPKPAILLSSNPTMEAEFHS